MTEERRSDSGNAPSPDAEAARAHSQATRVRQPLTWGVEGMHSPALTIANDTPMQCPISEFARPSLSCSLGQLAITPKSRSMPVVEPFIDARHSCCAAAGNGPLR